MLEVALLRMEWPIECNYEFSYGPRPENLRYGLNEDDTPKEDAIAFHTLFRRTIRKERRKRDNDRAQVNVIVSWLELFILKTYKVVCGF